MSVVKIGKRGILIIPADIRRKTGLREGDGLLIEVGEDGSLHMLKKPADFTGALRGLYKEVWRGVDTEKIKNILLVFAFCWPFGLCAVRFINHMALFPWEPRSQWCQAVP